MNHSKKIFKLLDIQPNEHFLLSGQGNTIFILTEDLTLKFKDPSDDSFRNSVITLGELLIGHAYHADIPLKIQKFRTEMRLTDFEKALGFRIKLIK